VRGGGQTYEREPTDDVREALAKAKQEFEEAVAQVEQDLTTEEALLDPYTLFCLARVYAGTSIPRVRVRCVRVRVRVRVEY
jgi:hypothetical protein